MTTTDYSSTPIDQLQRKVSVEFIRSSGTFAVEANVGSKAPVGSWSPKENNKDRSDAILTRALSDSFNLGVHLHGDVVDVDVDSDDPNILAALDMFLPACGHVWGRKSRPRTHRVYKLKEQYAPDEFAIMNRVKKLAGIELRGGELSRGQYSLLPSSVHPSGEVYEWHDLRKAQSTLTVSTARALVWGIRKAAAASAIAGHWTEGVRQDLAMALSGFLHRVWSTSQPEDGAPDTNMFAMDEADAMAFLKAVCELAGDDAKDQVMRQKAFKATWAKAESGAAVVGATRFAEITGDKRVVHFLYTMLSDNPNGEKIDEFLEKFAIRRNTTDVIDLEALSTGSVRAAVMPRQAFAQTYAYEKVLVGGKSVRIVDLFFEMASVRRISGVDVDPESPPIYGKGDELIANAWSGFEIPPHPDKQSDADVSPFTSYVLDVIAAGDQSRYRWVMSWLADLFQHPGEKPGTAVVLVGKQGAGKSMLGHSIIIPIIGQAHSTVTNSVERITRSFNANFANKLFVQCDEAINNRQKATAARLKSLVTDPTVHIEPKGVNGWDQTNLMRFIFTSNELDDALFISDGMHDRRYTVFEVSSHRARDLAYWDQLHKWLGVRDNLARIHRFLADWQYKREDLRRAMTTDAKIRLSQQAMTQFDEWLSTWVSNAHPLPLRMHSKHWHCLPTDGRTVDRTSWPTHVSLPLLVEALEAHCRNLRREKPEIWSEQQMRQRLAEVAPIPEPASVRLSVHDTDDKTGAIVRMRPRVHRVPSLEQVKAYLTDKYGIEFANYDDEPSKAPVDDAKLPY